MLNGVNVSDGTKWCYSVRPQPNTPCTPAPAFALYWGRRSHARWARVRARTLVVVHWRVCVSGGITERRTCSGTEVAVVAAAAATAAAAAAAAAAVVVVVVVVAAGGPPELTVTT